jgi:ankyrin repeat protein
VQWMAGPRLCLHLNALDPPPLTGIVGLTTIMDPRDLIKAACEGNAKLALAAIRRGANVNARYRGRPVLLWAIQEGHLNVVKVLVAAGASLRRRDDSGFSPLDQAVGEGNLEMVRFLLKAGADVNGPTVNGSPLHTACAWRRTQITKLLLNNGADPSSVDAEGHTPEALTRMGKTTKADSRLRALLGKAQQRPALDAAMSVSLHSRRQRRRASEAGRWAETA